MNPLLIRRRGMMQAATLQPVIPYQRIAYLESTGTQWINTGVGPDSQSKIECDAIWYYSAAPGSANSNPTLFGARKSSPLTMFEVLQQEGSNILYYQYGTDSPYLNDFTYGLRHIFVADANKLYVDGAVAIAANASLFDITFPVALYALNKGGNAERFSKAQVYEFKFWKQGTLVRDFVPVRVGTVGYMYDIVSEQLFGNAGTGAFVLGPDIQ